LPGEAISKPAPFIVAENLDARNRHNRKVWRYQPGLFSEFN
jgi:hypothetical protein